MEQLIEELVASTSRPSPARVLELQKEIQRLQRQPTGWNLGVALLKKSSSQLRFYGALTLNVKIQTDWWDPPTTVTGTADSSDQALR